MPQIELHTTSDLHENGDVPDILSALIDTVSRFETVEPRSVKAFHALRSVWAIGAGAPPGFVICRISVLEGRSEEWREELAAAILDNLRRSFAYSIEHAEAGISIEVREMRKRGYAHL